MNPALLSLDPNNLGPLYRRDPATGTRVADPHLDTLANAMRGGFDDAEKIDALAEAVKADATLTRSEASKQLRDRALALGKKVADAIDDARGKVSREIENVERQTGAPPPPRDPARIAELRSAIRELPSAERLKLYDNFDDDIASAFLGNHPVAVKMTEPEQNMYRERWRKVRHPDAADRLSRLREAVERVDRAGAAFVSFVNDKANTPIARQAEAGAARTAGALEATR